jgi:hypothetical protein
VVSVVIAEYAYEPVFKGFKVRNHKGRDVVTSVQDQFNLLIDEFLYGFVHQRQIVMCIGHYAHKHSVFHLAFLI